LEAGRAWQGNIYLSIRSTRQPFTPQINVERMGREWAYRLELPERVDKTQFVRTVVQALLMELANRANREQCAQVPLWLTEGFAQRLLASREAELLPRAPNAANGLVPVTPVIVQRRDVDPLADSRRILKVHPAATWDELSWPEPERFNPTQAEVFQCSAHLFVTELLELPAGREQLRRFITTLARYYNWQLAFLESYAAQFPTQLAVAKWWTLQATAFVGRDHHQLWTLEESASQLDAVLHATVAIRTRPGETPLRKEVSLQSVIRQWNTVQQLALLPDKVRELERLQLRLAAPFMVLSQEYRVVLTDYIRNRQLSTTTFAEIRELPPSIQKVALEAVRALDQLDARRISILREAQAMATNAASRASAP
jgi:hypothetical protein